MKTINFESVDEAFEFIENQEKLTLLIFCSDDCNTCPKQLEIIDELLWESSDFKAFKINIDKEGGNRNLAKQMELEILPSILVIKNGETVEIDDEEFENEFFLSGLFEKDEMKKIIALMNSSSPPPNLVMKTIFNTN